MDEVKYPSPAGLTAQIEYFLFWADNALRPDKLNAEDAEAMRRHRDRLETARDGFLSVAEKLKSHFPNEVAELSSHTAQMLHAASWIWQLHPAPTPNVRAVVEKQLNRAKGTKANAASRTTLRKTANDKAFKWARPTNFDGKERWIVAGEVEARMKDYLSEHYPGVKCLKQHRIYDRLGDENDY